MLIATLALAWLVGTYLVLFGDQPAVLAVPLLVLGLAAAPAAVAAWPVPRLRLAVLALACLVLGAARALWAEDALALDPLNHLHGQVQLLGLVASPPEVSGERTSLVLDVQARLAEDGWYPQAGRVWLQTYGGPTLTYGDAVLASGRLAEPRARPGDPLPAVLRRQGIRYLVEGPRVSLVERRPGEPLWTALDGVRQAIAAAIRQQLPEPQASLLAGVLVGTRAQMPPELRQALVASGTSHVVAVSGFNVAVLAGLALAALSWTVGRRHALLPALLVIGLYVLLTGPQPSAVRAALMGGAALIAVSVGRVADPLTSLLLAGALMLGLDPLQGLDVGFQLSFAATAGLVMLQPLLSTGLGRLPRWLRDPLAVTLAAQLATLPIIASTFHNVSLVSPLANLLIAPALPPLMALGGLLVLASPLPALASLVAWPSWLLLSYILGAIRLVGGLPGALLSVGSLPPALIAGLSALVVALGLLGLPDVRARLASLPIPPLQGTRALAVLALPLAALLALVLVPASRPDGRLHLWTLDLGNSLAVLARTPSGRTILLPGQDPPSRLAAVLPDHLRPWETRLGVVALASEADVPRLRPLLERYPAQTVVAPAPRQDLSGPAGVAALKLRDGAQVELDRDVVLAPLFAEQRAGSVAGWRLRYGTVTLSIVPGGAPRVPAAAEGSVAALLVLTDGDAWQPADAGPRAPDLLIAPLAVNLASMPGRSPLLLTSEAHGEVELESDGRGLWARPRHCLAPLIPPNCTLALDSGE